MDHIKDLVPLGKNPRRHTPRNIGLIVDALHEVGAARSIVIDENNEVLAGNGTLEAAAEAGIHKVQVVEADGETIIAVRRIGLSDEQKARLAILDNRANDLSGWDTQVLAEMSEGGVKLDDLWSADEMARLMSSAQAYAPTLDPAAAAGSITAADMERAQTALDKRFEDEKEQVQVTCPHCAGEFFLRRDNL